MKSRSLLILSGIWALIAVLLANVGGLLASAPLRALRGYGGRKAYWLLNSFSLVVLITFQEWEWAVVFLSLTVLVGSFVEFEYKGDPLFESGLCAVLITTLTLASLFCVGVLIKGRDLVLIFKARYELILTQFDEIYRLQTGEIFFSPELKQSFFTQLPSLFISALVLALVLSLVLEKRVFKLSGVRLLRPQYTLSDFKVPDLAIWIFIGSLLGSYWEPLNLPWAKAVCTNGLNIVGLLMFFQGLAVVTKTFDIYKVGLFWKTLLLLLLVFQLGLVLCLIGLMDYWLNFRFRLARYASQAKSGS